MKTIVISAFPACGKTWTYTNFNGKPYTMLDSDSSKFSWLYDENGNKLGRNPNFIPEYMAHIKENIGKVDVIFVSSHKEVRQALRDNGIKYFIVHPALGMKETFLTRMVNRGSDEAFVSFQREHFEQFVNEIEEECRQIIDSTPFVNGRRYLPFHEIVLDLVRPAISNDLIDELLDNCMGNLSSLWWNY